MRLYGFVTGEIEGIERSASPDLKEKHSALRLEHRLTLDLMEMQDAKIAWLKRDMEDIRAERLTLAALAYALSQQVIHAGQRPDCDGAALALCDAVLQEQHDVEWSECCGAACGVDEGE